MGHIINGYILPHPPILIPEVGQGEEKKARQTLDAMARVSQDIQHDQPDTIVLTTPHAPFFKDYAYISGADMLFGDLGRFGRKDVSMQHENDLELVDAIVRQASRRNIDAGPLSGALQRRYRVDPALDHGALVPLYFIRQQWPSFRLVHISTPDLPLDELYRFGQAIAAAIRQSSRRVVFVASGDLSHRLSTDAPGGYSPKGQPYDRFVVDTLASGDLRPLTSVDHEFMEEAGECGTRSIVILAGALDGRNLAPEIYSYEGPFGVGYLCARMLPVNRLPQKPSRNHHTRLAREALDHWLKAQTLIGIPSWVPESLRQTKAGAFVCLKQSGNLRGCIGTIDPVHDSLAEEIIHNAVSAGTRDPRFAPVTAEELPTIGFTVDVLTEPEPVESPAELDPHVYGVIVTSGRRRGLLLPDLDTVETPRQQIDIALRKAGIEPGEPYSLERFQVNRFEEAYEHD